MPETIEINGKFYKEITKEEKVNIDRIEMQQKLISERYNKGYEISRIEHLFNKMKILG